MSIFFGTDGVRGKYSEELSDKLAYRLGNALGRTSEKLKIIIGMDTRASGEILSLSFACGVMSAGSDITNVGVCPTAGISYLTVAGEYDYGVVVSASHNPAKYNGIKIFDKNGRKISEKEEDILEKRIFYPTNIGYEKLGKYRLCEELVDDYYEYLRGLFDFSLKGKKIVLDCSNGASYMIAPRLFKELGADVVTIGTSPDGLNINSNCGSLFIENLQGEVVKNSADFGFAYDGDSDRLVAVGEKGEIITGDHLVYIFSMYYKEKRNYETMRVVGTKHSNMGVEIELAKNNIEMIRADVGDKYVSEIMDREGLLVGGEQSGHIILKEFLQTGDGILSSLFLAYICTTENKTLSSYAQKIKLYDQCNINVAVKDKDKIMMSEKLSDIISDKNNELAKHGRLMVRASGTEQVIRVMVETNYENLSREIANEIVSVIKNID